MKVSVAVQYFVIAEKVYDAYYKLTDHRAQIRFYLSHHPSEPLLDPMSLMEFVHLYQNLI